MEYDSEEDSFQGIS